MNDTVRVLRSTPLVLALVAATACGTSSNVAATTVLSSAGTTSALVGRADLGKGYQPAPQANPGTHPTNCIAKLSFLLTDASGSVHHADVGFLGPDGTAQLRNSVATFNSAKDASAVFDDLDAIVKACGQDTGNSDGTKTSYTVTTSAKHTLSGVDSQMTVTASGSSKEEEVSAPISFRLTVARIGNNVMAFSYVDQAKDVATKADPLARTAYGQFHKVVGQ